MSVGPVFLLHGLGSTAEDMAQEMSPYFKRSDMGTLWLWEPEPLQSLIFKELGKDQVPATLASSGGCQHCGQLVLNTFEHTLAEARRAPFVKCIQLVGRIRLQICLCGLKA